MEECLSKIDRYEIIERLGGGGFSDVYLVEGPTGECAIKLLKEVSESKEQAALEEFKNEFAILKNLNHPNIARILDFGYDEEVKRYFYTSEMIRGKNIYEATENTTVEEITDLFVQAIRALEYLHSFRVYHFDIKAANILIVPGESPTVKIIDFGLAGIDPRGRLIGTPSYMSPEIINREPADGRSDLYSLAVLWYYCLARFNPFRSKITRETLQNHVHLIPPPPSEYNADVPEWISNIILRLLEKNPAKRFSVASRVMREINRFSHKKYPLETRETLMSYLPQEGELIGRQNEMETVREELKSLIHGDAKFKAVVIEGVLGSGKTRLIREFKYEAQLGEIRVHFASAADEEGYSRWRGELADHLNSGQDVAVFALDDVEALAKNEEAARELLGLIYRSHRPSGNARTLLLISTQEGEENPLIQDVKSSVPKRLQLDNFNPRELTRYLSSLTGLDKPPNALVDGIYRRTEGNPLFVTEVLKALIAGGALFDEGGRWRATVFEDVGVDFSRVDVPHTLGELLLDKVNALGSWERSMVEVLAVANRPLGGEALSKCTNIENPYPVLASLVQKEFLERNDEHQYLFKNELMGQLLYTTIPDEKRADCHSRIAEYLRQSEATPEDIAHHESFGAEKKVALKSALYLGEGYLKRGLGSSAATYLERAFELTDEHNVESKTNILLKNGEALLIAHAYKEAEGVFSEVEALLRQLPDTEQAAKSRIETLIRLGGTYMKMLSFDRARAAFNDAKSMLRTRIKDPASEIKVENFLGSVLVSEGRYGDARAIFEKTREMWRRLDPAGQSKATNNDLGITLLMLGEQERAREILNEDLKFAKELEDDLLISRAQYNLAQLSVQERHFGDAASWYEQCVDICKRSENTELLLRVYNGLGNILHMKGELDQSLAYYERGLALHERVGDPRGGAAISVNMGIIENSRGHTDEAIDLLVPAVEFLTSVPDKTDTDWAALSRGLLELGDVQRQLEKYDDAVKALGRAYGIADAHSSASRNRFWILYTLAEIAKEQNDESALKSLISRMHLIASSNDEKSHLRILEGAVEREEAPKIKLVVESPRSPAMQDVVKILNKVADTDISVLLVGESGVGKEFIARTLHENNEDRKKGQFVVVDCAAIPATLIENQLFGYKADAFTGARRDKKGLIEVASGGTLFFDEIGELESALQVKLLRVLKEGKYDIRVVAATKRDIDQLVREGSFRKDLYDVLCKVKVKVPPLRDRREDIPALAERFVAEIVGTRGLEICKALMRKFFEYPWPGNVRELKNIIEVACVLTEGEEIESDAIPSTSAFTQFFEKSKATEEPKVQVEISAREPKHFPIDVRNEYDPERTWRDYEKIIVAKAYRAYGCNAVKTAAALGISTATLYKRIAEWNLKDHDNPIYKDPFEYTDGEALDEYLPQVFKAALDYTHGRTTKAIANLGVSQGYFYKVMKRAKATSCP